MVFGLERHTGVLPFKGDSFCCPFSSIFACPPPALGRGNAFLCFSPGRGNCSARATWIQRVKCHFGLYWSYPVDLFCLVITLSLLWCYFGLLWFSSCFSGYRRIVLFPERSGQVSNIALSWTSACFGLKMCVPMRR